MKTTAHADVVLVALLARQNAIFTPVRIFEPKSPWAANCYFARKDFVTNGIPWALTHKDDASRKRDSRALEVLAAGGLVRPVKTNNRTVGVFLNQQGERRAQKLAGVPILDAGFNFMERHLLDIRPMWIGEDDCPPLLFGLGFQYERISALIYLADLMLPWVTRGNVEARSTGAANVRYRATGADMPPQEDYEPVPDEEAIQPVGESVYEAELEEYRGRLKTETPAVANELGEIPLGASWNYKDEYYVESVHGARTKAELATS